MYPRSLLALVLAAALAVPAQGQQVSGPKSNLAPQSAQGLKIVVIQGEGATNSTRAKVATQPVVEVRDESDKPVAGAEVIFRLPGSGPGGAFNGWMRTQTTKTDSRGQATTTGFVPNEELGSYEVQVSASMGQKTGSATIHQSNVRSLGSGAQAKSGRSGTWKILAALGGAAAVGAAIALTRDNKSSSTPAAVPITVTPGPITVGAPR